MKVKCTCSVVDYVKVGRIYEADDFGGSIDVKINHCIILLNIEEDPDNKGLYTMFNQYDKFEAEFVEVE